MLGDKKSLGTHNEKNGLGEFDTHRKYWRQEGQREIINLNNELV